MLQLTLPSVGVTAILLSHCVLRKHTDDALLTWVDSLQAICGLVVCSMLGPSDLPVGWSRAGVHEF